MLRVPLDETLYSKIGQAQLPILVRGKKISYPSTDALHAVINIKIQAIKTVMENILIASFFLSDKNIFYGAPGRITTIRPSCVAHFSVQPTIQQANLCIKFYSL